MEYRCVTTPEGGIPGGETVECESFDLVSGRLVKAGKIRVFGMPPNGHEGGKSAMAVYIENDGCWVIQWEDC